MLELHGAPGLNPPVALEEVNSVAETAAYLKLTEQKVAELLRNRKLAGIKEGRTWIVPRAAIEAYIERNVTQVATPEPNPWGLSERSLRRVKGRTF